MPKFGSTAGEVRARRMTIRRPRVIINGSFRGQQVTGQQRYASEVSAELSKLGGFVIQERSVPRMFQQNRWLCWGWAQTLAAHTLAGNYLLTLTSRGPFLSRRHVVTIHDLFVLNHPEWFSRAYRITHSFALYWQIRSAALIVAVSEPVADQLRALKMCGARVVVAPNAPAQLFLQKQDASAVEDALAELGLTTGSYLLALSSSDPRKNLGHLYAAFGLVAKDLRQALPLVVVGPGESVVFAGRSRPIPADVIQLGFVSDEQLAMLYRGARAVLFPTLDEGFGLPAVEALASGATLIASDIAVLHWVCGTFATYLDPRSVRAWTELITRMASDQFRPTDEATRLARRASVEDRFSWKQSAEIIFTAIADSRTSSVHVPK